MATFQIQTDDIKIRMEYHHDDSMFEGFKQFRIGRGGKCVDILYDPSPFFSNELQLHGLSYHKDCLMNKPIMTRGIDTVAMAKLALIFAVDYLRTHFAIQINHITISDNSTFDCFGQTVFLCAYDFLIYGQTWYERKFDAIPTLPQQRDLLNSYRHKLHQPIAMNFTLFSKLFETDDNVLIQKANRLYNPNHTWVQQCKLYHDEYGCQFVSNLLIKIYEKLGIRIVEIQKIQFMIPSTAFEVWRKPYEWTATTGGGRKRKQRNSKKKPYNYLFNPISNQVNVYGIGKMELTLEDI